MSDLRPVGTPIMLNGMERNFLFTLNVIDSIQSHYDLPVLEVLGKLFDEKEKVKTLKFLVTVLLNDEVEGEKYKNGNGTAKEVTEREVGAMIHVENMDEVIKTILKAYGISEPDADEDEVPNQKSEQQSN